MCICLCVCTSMQSSVATLKVASMNRCSPCVEHSVSHRSSPSSSSAAVCTSDASSPMPVPPRSSAVVRLTNELRVGSMASCGRSVSMICCNAAGSVTSEIDHCFSFNEFHAHVLSAHCRLSYQPLHSQCDWEFSRNLIFPVILEIFAKAWKL